MHHSACMHQKHLLRFIKSKLKKRPHEVVIFRDGKYLTLLEVFQSLQLTGSAPRACLPGPRACLALEPACLSRPGRRLRSGKQRLPVCLRGPACHGPCVHAQRTWPGRCGAAAGEAESAALLPDACVRGGRFEAVLSTTQWPAHMHMVGALQIQQGMPASFDASASLRGAALMQHAMH